MMIKAIICFFVSLNEVVLFFVSLPPVLHLFLRALLCVPFVVGRL